jgi:hypothetical protein
MADLETTQMLDPLAFATELRIFARDRAPDAWSENQVQQLATRLQMKYGTSSRLKKVNILLFAKGVGGTSSSSEVRERFHWPRQSVHELLDELETERKIEFFDATPAGPKKAGRPSRRFRLL